jgi:hypothetical protein
VAIILSSTKSIVVALAIAISVLGVSPAFATGRLSLNVDGIPADITDKLIVVIDGDVDGRVELDHAGGTTMAHDIDLPASANIRVRIVAARVGGGNFPDTYVHSGGQQTELKITDGETTNAVDFGHRPLFLSLSSLNPPCESKYTKCPKGSYIPALGAKVFSCIPLTVGVSNTNRNQSHAHYLDRVTVEN